MEALFGGLGLIAILLMIVVGFAIQTVFVYFSAKWFDAPNRSFGTCFLAVLITFVINLVVSVVLGLVLPFLSILALPIGIAVSAAVFSKMMDVTFVKGLLITIVSWLLAMVVFFVLALIFGGVVGFGAMALGGAA